MLVCGLTDWGGPLEGTELLAAEMGFSSLDDLYEDGERIAAAIGSGQPLSVRDWARALLATEFAFAMGADEWTSIQGGTPEHWNNVLHHLQSKLAKPRGQHGS